MVALMIRRTIASRPRDRVLLRNLTFHATHGNLAEEKVLHQRFEVDITLHTCLEKAGATDQLADTVDYVEAYNIAKSHIVEGSCRNLVESLADGIARDLLRSLRGVERARVQVRKPQVCIPGPLDFVGVEVERSLQEDSD